jgi:hypothetical protein
VPQRRHCTGRALVRGRESSTECVPARGATGEHGGLLGAHPLPGEHKHHLLRQQLASTPWLASMRVRDGEESHRLHDGEMEESERSERR